MRTAGQSLAPDRRLDLGETGDDRAGLARQPEPAERRFPEPRGDLVGEIGGGRHAAASGRARRRSCFTASATSLRSAPTQMPRPGSLALRSGDDAAVRRGDETDQLRLRQHGARDRAHARAARSAAAVPSSIRSSASVKPWPASSCGAAASARRRREIGLGDDAGLEPRRHDDRLGLRARDLDARQRAFEARRSRRPCARSSRPGRRRRNRRDPRAS